MSRQHTARLSPGYDAANCFPSRNCHLSLRISHSIAVGTLRVARKTCRQTNGIDGIKVPSKLVDTSAAHLQSSEQVDTIAKAGRNKVLFNQNIFPRKTAHSGPSFSFRAKMPCVEVTTHCDVTTKYPASL